MLLRSGLMDFLHNSSRAGLIGATGLVMITIISVSACQKKSDDPTPPPPLAPTGVPSQNPFPNGRYNPRVPGLGYGSGHSQNSGRGGGRFGRRPPVQFPRPPRGAPQASRVGYEGPQSAKPSLNALVCTRSVERDGECSSLGISRFGRSSKRELWDMKKAISMELSPFDSEGTKVHVSPELSGKPSRIRLSFKQKIKNLETGESRSERKRIRTRDFTAESSMEQGLSLRFTDEICQEETLIECYLEKRIQSVGLSGSSIRCEGQVTLPGRQASFPIAETFSWNGIDSAYKQILVNGQEGELVELSIEPQFEGRTGTLSVNFESGTAALSLGQVSAISQGTPALVKLNEPTSGFSLDMSCINQTEAAPQTPK